MRNQILFYLLGIAGADGIPGVSGHAGPRGLTGRVGRPGRPGRMGQRGPPGPPPEISAEEFYTLRDNCESLIQEVETLKQYFNAIIRSQNAETANLPVYDDLDGGESSDELIPAYES